MVNWAPIDVRKLQTGDWGNREVKTQAALRLSGVKLYAVFQTFDANLLRNTGDSLATLFKTGGCLDVMIGAAGADPERSRPVAGDLRLLVNRVNVKPVGVLYRPVDSVAKTKPIQYTSAVRSVRIDSVEDISADVQLAYDAVKDEQGRILEATYEFSVPLSRLGLHPVDGQRIKGDLGILRGDGVKTLQRLYWSHKASGLVSDTPSEAELTPHLWGTFTFKSTP